LTVVRSLLTVLRFLLLRTTDHGERVTCSPATITLVPNVTCPQAQIRTILLLLAASAAAAQTITPPSPKPAAHKPRPHPKSYQAPYNPNVVVLDPAHGGSDDGAKLSSDLLEKDFNISFANRLKSLLEAQGFTVVLTHAAATDDTPPDQRVETANRSRAVACLLLHASNAGRGIHLFNSALTAPALSDEARSDAYIVPWDTAQAASLPKSLQLTNEFSTALNGLRVPLIVGRVSVSPIDSMTCPAVAVEIAPATVDSKVSDEDYQQRIAQSLVTALTYWRQHAQAQIAAQSAAQAAAPAPSSATPAPAPKAKPKPKPIVVHPPDESPLAPEVNTPKPAPIERRPPPPPSTPPYAGDQR
jgi:N-acetylmuramoyl-L-alanine amidase